MVCSTELSRPENQGLEKAMNLLQDLKNEIDEGAKGGPITWSDLIHIGGIYSCWIAMLCLQILLSLHVWLCGSLFAV